MEEKELDEKLMELHKKDQELVKEASFKNCRNVTMNGRDFMLTEGIAGKLFYSGFPFGGDYVPDALRKAERFGRALSVPELIHEKVSNPESMIWKIDEIIDSDLRHRDWRKGLITSTEEVVAKTKYGTPAYVVIHGGGTITSERLRQVYRTTGSDIRGGIPVTEREVADLFAGKLEGDIDIPLYSFSEFLKMDEKPTNYGIIIDWDDALKARHGTFTTEKAIKDPLIVARCGGVENIIRYREAREMKGKEGRDVRLFSFTGMDPRFTWTRPDPDRPTADLLWFYDVVYDKSSGNDEGTLLSRHNLGNSAWIVASSDVGYKEITRRCRE